MLSPSAADCATHMTEQFTVEHIPRSGLSCSVVGVFIKSPSLVKCANKDPLADN